jgi:MFS family permease
MILAGIGGGMFVAPNISSIMNASPAARRGIAAGISATMITTGFLLSLGLAFVIMASTMPLSTLQAIFAGLPVAANELNVSLFMGAMDKMFLLMAGISLVAAIPSSMRGQKPIRRATINYPQPTEV